METATETRYIVRTHDLPNVTVDEVEWECDTCHLGLYESEEEAWRAAEGHLDAYLRDSYVARYIMVQELDERIDRAEKARFDVRKRIGGPLFG